MSALASSALQIEDTPNLPIRFILLATNSHNESLTLRNDVPDVEGGLSWRRLVAAPSRNYL